MKLAETMVRAINESIVALKAWFEVSEKRFAKILSAQGVIGKRAAPTQAKDNDRTIGTRLDFAGKITKDGTEHQRYHMQVNKDAHDPTLKKFAANDSHQVWSYADVPLEPPKEKTREQLFEDLFVELKAHIGETPPASEPVGQNPGEEQSGRDESGAEELGSELPGEKESKQKDSAKKGKGKKKGKK